MKVVVFGATGMVGRGVLLEALDSDEVSKVLSVGRSTTEISHPKLEQVIHEDFSDFRPLAPRLKSLDACFWCVGVSAIGCKEAEYVRVTYDFTLAAASVLYEQSPDLRFCFVTSEGTSDNGSGPIMWARVKGQAENALKVMGFREVILFRPGFVKPMRGSLPRGAIYEIVYSVFGLFNPFLRLMGSATSTLEIGRAMVVAAKGEADKQVLNSPDINRLAVKLGTVESGNGE